MTGLQIMEAAGMDMEAESWDQHAFDERLLPVVVVCADCNGTVALPRVAWSWCPDADDPGVVAYRCHECHGAVQSEVEDAEHEAGWDPHP